MDLTHQVTENAAAHRLWAPGRKLVVAVSGGLDSVALLHVLASLRAPQKLSLVVAHLHHGLRGHAATRDQRMVEQWAESLGLPVRCARVDVGKLAREQGVSLEMAARVQRHAFLARIAREERARSVVLAHHEDDQVELFLMRLLRGAGSEGLSGMKWKAASPADPRVELLRPLLNVSKLNLWEHVRKHHLKYREDASNQNHQMLRNRIRGELLPLLESRYQPQVRRILLRVMEILRQESACLEESLAHLRDDKVPWQLWPAALQRRSLQAQLETLQIPPEFDLVEALRARPEMPVMVAPCQVVVGDGEGALRLETLTELPVAAEPLRVVLGRISGQVTWGGCQLWWKLERHRQSRGLPKPAAGREYFDADAVGEVIWLRSWQAGDRFQPIGMKHAVKLQDWFTNRKIPRETRHRLAVATTDAGEIWWVEGQRIGEAFKVTPATRRRLRWQWERGSEVGGLRSEV